MERTTWELIFSSYSTNGDVPLKPMPTNFGKARPKINILTINKNDTYSMVNYKSLYSLIFICLHYICRIIKVCTA